MQKIVMNAGLALPIGIMTDSKPGWYLSREADLHEEDQHLAFRIPFGRSS